MENEPQVSDKEKHQIINKEDQEMKVIYENQVKAAGASVEEFKDAGMFIRKAREFQKNIYFCFIDYTKAFDVWITTNCGKFFKRWEYQAT